MKPLTPASRRLIAAGGALLVVAATLVGLLWHTQDGRVAASPQVTDQPTPAGAGEVIGTPRPRPAPAAVPVLGQATPANQAVRKAAGGKQPNIVLVMMDDMRYDELRFAPQLSHEVVDRGITFQNSFSPYPLCCPARATFLTGKYAHNHGVLYIRNPLAFGAIDDRVTIASRLSDAGYRTALVGKYLNRYGTAPSRVTGKSSVRYIPHGWTDWMAALDAGWRLAGRTGGGAYHYFDMTQNVNGSVVFNTGTYSSDLVGREATALVGEYHREKAPFFLYLAPVAPHNGVPFEPDDPPKDLRTATGGYDHLGTPARPDWVKGRFDAAIRKGLGIRSAGSSEADVTDKPAPIAASPDLTPAERRAVREIERQRAESIFAWDKQFGILVDELKRTGEYDDTVFVLTSDNGYFNGEHRQREGKIWSHEPALRVPLVVAGPGIPHGVRYTPASTADLTATVLELAQARALPAMDGHSVLGAVTGPDRPWTVPVLTEGLLRNIPRTTTDFPRILTTSGLRTARWKYTRYADGFGELYDLREDPNELTNLYADPAHRAVRDELTQVWLRLRGCRAAQCQVPLPPSLRTPVDRLARLDARFTAGVQRWFR